MEYGTGSSEQSTHLTVWELSIPQTTNGQCIHNSKCILYCAHSYELFLGIMNANVD